MASDTAKTYWDANPTAGYTHQWTANPVIADIVYRRMTGGKSVFWLNWLFRDYFAGRRFDSLLSPGCGVGAHELAIAKLGAAAEIDAFDFSAECVRQADQKAKAAGHAIHFYQDDLNTFSVPPRHYDLVFCSGSVHHCRELERFFATTAQCLKPGGYFILNEYIGPCYNLYPDSRVKILDRLLALLPPRLKAPGADHFVNGTLQLALAHDPSESVRSELILSFLTQFFDIELRRDYGGTILHPLYPLLNNELFSDPSRECLGVVLKLLAEIELLLIESDTLRSDFTLCICRPKR